jgi:hypothetical protein
MHDGRDASVMTTGKTLSAAEADIHPDGADA